MTPYKEDIFRELKQVLAQAKPEQIQRLLNDIATGQFCETAQTRAGENDNHCNVTSINQLADRRHAEAGGVPIPTRAVHTKCRTQLSVEARNVRRAGYSS